IAPYRDGVAAYAQQTARLLWNFRYFEQLLGLATEEEFLRLWDFDLTLTELVHWQKPELDETLASNYINIVSAHFAAGNAEKVIEAVEKAAAYAEKIPIEQRNIGTKSGFDENGNGISRHFEENLREFLADFYMSATEDNDYLPHLGLHENPRLIDAIKRIRGTE
ncbi:MAG: hypothetical protein LBN00_11710, partial [Oscillospiraceae bacterium]|nr:hypothetical protein [Oscillospiraceae bacterium]